MVKRRIQNKKNIFTNFIIISTLLLTTSFFVSFADYLFFGNVEEVHPDLESLIPKTKYEHKTGHKITVEIHNGCGIPKLANLYTEFLRNEGYDVIDSRNADNFNYKNTQIQHHRGDKKRALSLSETMKIDESLISEIKSSHLIHDLTLILGNDYQQLNSYENAVIHETPF